MVHFVSSTLPTSLVALAPEIEGRYELKGSAGQSQWTFTPWLAVLDPAVTTSVQEGFYVVYLLASDGSDIYLSLNQGCTTLKDALGISGARTELEHRASVMRSRIKRQQRRLVPDRIDLRSNLWRADLYEAGNVVSVRYKRNDIPPDDELALDLREALQLCEALKREGGWSAEDEILRDADDAYKSQTLVQAKIYRQHRTIERQPSHSKAVKKALGHRCMACAFEMTELYGEAGKNLIEAHHLTPLSTLADGAVVTFDPRKDFAVLCPNCHSVIHRMPDPSDLEGLRALVRHRKSA